MDNGLEWIGHNQWRISSDILDTYLIGLIGLMVLTCNLYQQILIHSSLWMQISQWARVNLMHRYQWPYGFFPPPFSFLQGFLAPPPGWTFPGMPPWKYKHSAGGDLHLAAPVPPYPPHPYFPHSSWRRAWTFLLDVRLSLGDVLLQSGGCARSLLHFQACSAKFLCIFWTHLVLILD